MSNFEAVGRLFGVNPNVPNWWKARSNVARAQDAPIVRLRDGERELVQLRWGLIPYWSKDAKIACSTINARAETVATAASFREAFKRRRCLVVIDGFYEWQKLDSGAKQPYRIVMKDREPFGLAGLWERWRPAPEAEHVETFTIITTTPNAVSAPIHNRVPVVIAPADFDSWLSIAPGSEELLRPFPSEPMEAYPVSKAVGNVKNEGLELVEPLETKKRA